MSKEVKKAGHDAVIRHEKRKGRKAVTHERDGYDIFSKGRGQIRHIEVKATSKESFTWRHLTDAEFQAAMSDPEFYLYLVTHALRKPQITELRRDDILKRYRGTTVLHVISFAKSRRGAKKRTID